MDIKSDRQIIFFDGVCSLCNAWVDFLVRHDHERNFRVASLQGQTAKVFLPAERLNNMSSILLWSQGELFEQSDAVLTILVQLGFPWSLAKLFFLVPRPIRNFFYQLVAKSRYQIFGKRDSCRLPTKEERSYFLD